MKEIEFKAKISDEDYARFIDNSLHIRAYCQGNGNVLFVTVPKERQDMLDQNVFNDIALRKIVSDEPETNISSEKNEREENT